MKTITTLGGFCSSIYGILALLGLLITAELTAITVLSRWYIGREIPIAISETFKDRDMTVIKPMLDKLKEHDAILDNHTATINKISDDVAWTRGWLSGLRSLPLASSLRKEIKQR